MAMASSTAPITSSIPRRTRAHAGGAGALVVRPMVKSTEGVKLPTRAPLVVVAPRRRHAARWVALAAVFMFCTMLAAAAFQMQLAPRQVTLDQLDTQIAAARSEYDVLRRERAELRAPERLERQALALGMVPVSDNHFLTIDPEVVAEVQASTGGVFTDDGGAPTEFSELQAVKSVAGSAP